MNILFQTTKEEFDCEARSLMTEDQVRLHNEFLLCLFNKVRGLATITPTYKIDRDKTSKEKRLRLKRKYKTDKSNFEVCNTMYIMYSDNNAVRVYMTSLFHCDSQQICTWKYWVKLRPLLVTNP